MLLPTLNKARDKAHQTECLNNAKSVMQTHQLYSNDFNDYMVVLTTNYTFAEILMGVELGGESENWGYTKVDGMTSYLSPSYKKRFACSKSSTYLSESFDEWQTNGMYFRVWDATYGTEKEKYGDFVVLLDNSNIYYKVTRAKKPSGMYVYGDTARLKTSSWNSVPRSHYRWRCDSIYNDDNAAGGLWISHNDKSNVAFLDGHTDALSAHDLYNGAMKVKRMISNDLSALGF